MATFGRLPTPEEFERRFTDFVLLMGGERVADALGDPASYPLNADYLLWSRAVVAELKCINTNHMRSKAVGDRMSQHLSKAVSAGLVTREKSTGRYQVGPGAPPRVLHEMTDALAMPLLKLADQASRQIRSTKRVLSLPQAHGLWIVVNLADQRMDADTAAALLRRSLRQHGNTLNFLAYYSPIIGAEVDGERASLVLTGRNGEGLPDSVMEKVSGLMRSWLTFNDGHFLHSGRPA